MAAYIKTFSQFFLRSFHSTPLFQRTVNQLMRQGPNARQSKKKPHRFLGNRPQIKGIVLETMTVRPRKPNSGERRCCRVRLSNKKEAIAFIPKEGHTLQPTDVVLLEGANGRHLVSVKLRVVRGKYNCAHPVKKN
ncbi:PREDICTED: 28S ribosomal protein S12, mitochondrial-like [Amphimedon queenslandica]|uniref:Small ribosomal subunit protein uS12m n=1 Tax=Amphimedon queenslandica TaxID=400682 RepID=A0A1X7V999_AMPQE|nr:PREDICTED: 28S ribosomal protein S12, mitochondrial-like [Amphimedon queenslandica]|eukprot:XP_003385234.2 PREDICTED: 28S ribosomal protein S12, mitochondrial-like [Amphimedon queenslandica]